MTLYEFLIEQKCEHVKSAFDKLIGNGEEFYKDLGRIYMCDHIFKVLSDESLKMEVKTRHDTLSNSKGE